MAFGYTKLKYQHFKISCLNIENMAYITSNYEKIYV